MKSILPGGLALALGLLASIAMADSPSSADAPDEAAKVTRTGKVVMLPELVKSLGLAFDLEPIAEQVVLVDEAGEATPLLCDDASRALFKDGRLRGRRTRIVGKPVAGLPYLQVLLFGIEEEGRFRTPEYYCVICTISVRFPQTCPCCQGSMELRMRPER